MSPGIGDRISDWLEARSTAWKDRLKGWAGSVISFGVEVFLDIVAKKGAAQLAPLIKTLEDTKAVPPELQPLLDELKNPTGELAGLNAASLVGRITGGAVSKILDAILIDIAYSINYNTMRLRPSEQDMIQLYSRNHWTAEQLREGMRIHGYNPAVTNQLRPLWELILPSDIVIPAWLRDKKKYQFFMNSLPYLGLSPRQIELLTEMTYKLPTAQEAITWMAREVFEPEMVAKYGLDDEADKIDYSFMETIGLKEDTARKHWRAHWQHASWAQVIEMLHRGPMTEKDVYDWFRLVEIPPYWRKGLTQVMWNTPNRIELRMMARYGLVDKAFLVDALKKDGLAEEYRDIVADMNLVLGIRADLQTRYSKGWITAGQVEAELEASGLSADIRSRVYQYIVANEAAQRTVAQKNLTLAQIIKGVRKNKLSRPEAVDLIIDLGYDGAEAKFVLDVEMPADETNSAVRARELTKSDILAGLKAGTINAPTARQKLLDIRYTPGDADFIIRVYQMSITPPPQPEEREISKADVVSAVKQGLVTPEQGYQLLIGIGFSAEASRFILSVAAGESPFSPMNYDEYKQLTRSLRAAQGLSTEALPAGAQELQLQKAQAIAEGRNPMLEQLRIQIDTIRRRRRSGITTREQELGSLQALNVPADYIAAIVANDDTRIEARKLQGK